MAGDIINSPLLSDESRLLFYGQQTGGKRYITSQGTMPLISPGTYMAAGSNRLITSSMMAEKIALLRIPTRIARTDIRRGHLKIHRETT
jgi:hypothetical protein